MKYTWLILLWSIITLQPSSYAQVVNIEDGNFTLDGDLNGTNETYLHRYYVTDGGDNISTVGTFRWALNQTNNKADEGCIIDFSKLRNSLGAAPIIIQSSTLYTIGSRVLILGNNDDNANITQNVVFDGTGSNSCDGF